MDLVYHISPWKHIAIQSSLSEYSRGIQSIALTSYWCLLLRAQEVRRVWAEGKCKELR